MGKQTIIVVLCFVVIVSTVLSVLGRRQSRATEAITETHLSHVARQTANSSAQQGIVLFKEAPNVMMNQQPGSRMTLINQDDTVVDLIKLDNDGNFRLISTANVESIVDQTVFVGETVVEFQHVSAGVLVSYNTYLLFVELWNDLYFVHLLNDEERAVLAEAGVLPDEINCAPGCDKDHHHHVQGCDHLRLHAQYAHLFADNDLHIKVCPIHVDNGGLNQHCCQTLAMRQLLRNNHNLHMRIASPGQGYLHPGGLWHYFRLVDYYGVSDLPPYFHFGESMQAQYDDMAAILRTGGAVASVGLENVAIALNQNGFNLDLDEFLNERRTELHNTDNSFRMMMWSQRPSRSG